MMEKIRRNERLRRIGIAAAVAVAMAGTAYAQVDAESVPSSDPYSGAPASTIDTGSGQPEPGAGCGGGCGRREVEPRGRGRCGGSAGAGRGGGRGQGANGALMENVRALVHDYRQDIERQVEEIEGGVVTVTRSPSNPAAARTLERHVRQMQDLLETGGRIRAWDPLFRELFEHSDEITLEIEVIEDGLRVTETSDDPAVVQLIRAHAHKVSEFIARGPAAVHEETPLPAGYRLPGDQDAAASRP